MKIKNIWIIVLLTGCSVAKINTDPVSHFPLRSEKAHTLPAKENFYLYILAGQSNMAGRGLIHAEDTISSKRVLTLNKNDEWVYAKEPLHYYEPTRTGLDCGLSFGKSLSDKMDENITIGLIPCAVGGSSIEQWLYDSTYRNVTLYTNLIHRIKVAQTSGTLKGMLWHQGESNSGKNNYPGFQSKLQSFFQKLRKDINMPEMPIYIGMLGSFLTKESFPNADLVNHDLKKLPQTLDNVYVIKTNDLRHNPDTVHFDAESQRILGQRFARKVYESIKSY